MGAYRKWLTPEQLKVASFEELIQQASAVRQFLIESLAETGGHLAPNLGVVELTIALHRVYTSPKDKLIWDVGHQAYVHKLLTERGNHFHTLRQCDGLDGFPKRSESLHDVWESGHSSTSLSAASGFAIARDLFKQSHAIVPIIGDGALTSGLAYEALQTIGDKQLNITIVLNDNGMSIAPNVGALHKMLQSIRTKPFIHNMNDAEGTAPFFESLGLKYIGPIDGHDIQSLSYFLEKSKQVEGPVILHVLTVKGKGYLPAEEDQRGIWHGVAPYDIATGNLKTIAKMQNWSEFISDTLIDFAQQDEAIVAITPAMSVGSQLEKFQRRFPNRFFDVGIAEQHAMTMAAAMGMNGLKPFVSIYSTFLQRAYDQLIHDVCRQSTNVFIGIDRSGLVGADGETHQGIYDVSFLMAVPDLVVMMPKNAVEAQVLMRTGFAYEGPIAMRYPRGYIDHPPLKETIATVPIGSWEVTLPGATVAIIAYGPMVKTAIEVAALLKVKGILIEVVNARFIKPMDFTYLNDLANRKIPVFIIEEAITTGGLGESVLSYLHDKTAAPIQIMGLPNHFIPHGKPDEQLHLFGIDTVTIAKKIHDFIENME
ncbi:1-deoxy-D-xylulose-5-phosphate synthase [Brochothrix thermosphacta]|uniref:1-deoxy-D-xylulose-5-phosphate synthase n=1 Tax=Brochothrix thermosphacta TaxID=2756 RepID=UPI0003E8BA2F|nr:1-deoxy-D-xylulose-5-phosphate synthase [Brochothrix thermosphacta]EUJ35339.1 1-deoxy-D-xylulose-5-phosphate synthase [Brochothrix thermosphacta DSM 20171 = FSL F6-1036]ODJ49571.1 1-deoxy-D-xylulose-5-phosphate synthase [Brochothrix thermosphacta DSM 20171 = FSL F6-1036]